MFEHQKATFPQNPVHNCLFVEKFLTRAVDYQEYLSYFYRR